MKYFKFFNLKEFSIFFWLILIGIIGISISTIYSKNKSNEEEKIMAHKGKGSCGSKGKGGKKGYR